MIHSTAQVQSNSQITDIPLTKRQRLKQMVIRTTMYLPVSGIEPMSSVLSGECVTY